MWLCAPCGYLASLEASGINFLETSLLSSIFFISKQSAEKSDDWLSY